LGAAAFSDYFIFIVPLDALVVASFMAARKNWLRLNFLTTLGSTLGAGLFALFIQNFGTGLIDQLAPTLLHSDTAHAFSLWLARYGFLSLVGISILPIHQHPTVAIAALAKVSLTQIFLALFLGRFLKYCLYYLLIRSAHLGFMRFFKE
jgi:membrane protein YqaA with SNARE-associated domain